MCWHVPACLSFCRSIYLYLSICLSVYLSVSICLYLRSAVNRSSTDHSTDPTHIVNLCDSLYVYVSSCLSICLPSVWLKLEVSAPKSLIPDLRYPSTMNNTGWHTMSMAALPGVLHSNGFEFVNFSHSIAMRAASRMTLLAWTIRVVHELQFYDVEDGVMQLQTTMSDVIATLGYIFCGDVIVDRFRPLHMLQPMILCSGALCDNLELQGLTRRNKQSILEEIKHPMCHYYAGLIGSHVNPPREKAGHRRFRAMKRILYI